MAESETPATEPSEAEATPPETDATPAADAPATADAAAEDTVAAHAAAAHGAGHGDHGSEIHMPPNSWWPLVTSLGITVALLGVLYLESMPVILIVGLVILLLGVGGWVKDARTEYRELH